MAAAKGTNEWGNLKKFMLPLYTSTRGPLVRIKVGYPDEADMTFLPPTLYLFEFKHKLLIRTVYEK